MNDRKTGGKWADMAGDVSIKTVVEQITKELNDKGLLIEAGWRGFELFTIPGSGGTIQRQEMRTAFFAGAQHLWGSIMTVLEPDAEPTEKDLERMTLIQNELDRFVEELKNRQN